MSKDEQAVAASSEAEGMHLGLVAAGAYDKANRLRQCMSGWTTAQGAAVMLKWLTDNPSKRNYAVGLIFNNAIAIGVCDLQRAK